MGHSLLQTVKVGNAGKLRAVYSSLTCLLLSVSSLFNGNDQPGRRSYVIDNIKTFAFVFLSSLPLQKPVRPAIVLLAFFFAAEVRLLSITHQPPASFVVGSFRAAVREKLVTRRVRTPRVLTGSHWNRVASEPFPSS